MDKLRGKKMNEPKFYDGNCPRCKAQTTFRYEGRAPSEFENILIYQCLNCHEMIRKSGGKKEKRKLEDLFCSSI